MSGNVHNELKGTVGVKLSAHMKETEDRVQQILKKDPVPSIVRLVQQLGVSWSTAYHKEDIGLFPYKVLVLQKYTAFRKQ